MSTADSIPDKIIVLLSGGMDSATCLGLAQMKVGSDNVIALSFYYGQTHSAELEMAQKLCDHYKIRYLPIKFEFADLFNSSEIIYAGTKPLGKDYMPFRNMICFSVAFGYAQAHGYNQVWYGGNADDVFPDNLPPFLNKINESLKAMECDIELVYPLMEMRKDEIIHTAKENFVPLHLTRTCYLSGKKSCGKCLACEKRLEGFEKAGVTDPLEYE